MPLLLGKQGCFGLTLLELMIVLVIVVVLAMIALPNFLNFNQQSRVVGAAEGLLYNLQYARSAAVEHDETVYVVFNTSNPYCYGITASISQSCDCTGVNTSSVCELGAFTGAEANQITMTVSTNLVSSALSFEGTRGQANNSLTTINFIAHGQTVASGPAVSVQIQQLGDMELCSSTVGGYPTCS